MPAARKWTEEEITEIKRLYCEEGLALVKVGEKFNASKQTIQRLLTKQGIRVKSNGNRRPITREQINDFHRRYKSGESFESIGKSYGYASGDPIATHLEKARLYKRVEGADEFPRRNYPDVVSAYKAGTNTEELAKKYKCAGITIRNVLIRSGVELRSKSEAFGFPSKSDQKKICEYYLEGNTLEATAQKFDCARQTVKKVLRLHDKRIRDAHESKTGIHPNEWDTICRRYIEGEESSTSIAEDYKVANETITRIVTRGGSR